MCLTCCAGGLHAMICPVCVKVHVACKKSSQIRYCMICTSMHMSLCAWCLQSSYLSEGPGQLTACCSDHILVHSLELKTGSKRAVVRSEDEIDHRTACGHLHCSTASTILLPALPVCLPARGGVDRSRKKHTRNHRNSNLFAKQRRLIFKPTKLAVTASHDQAACAS